VKRKLAGALEGTAKLRGTRVRTIWEVWDHEMVPTVSRGTADNDFQYTVGPTKITESARTRMAVASLFRR